MNKISLADLAQLVKHDLEFAKENALLSADHECFHEQKEYWNGKVDALERVVKAINMTQEVVDVIQKKKKTFLNFFSASS
jgi:sulfur relay (sulfurtransferase) DsrC/TusE family protein